MPRKPRSLLSPLQDMMLDLCAGSPLATRFTFTGGTALTAVYLGHRYSDDLDFFSVREVDTLALAGFARVLARRGLEIRRETRGNRHLLHLTTQRSERLRVEFVYFPFDPVERGTPWRGLVVDSLLDIAVNKVHAVTTRAEPKDLVDLYAILKARRDLSLRRLLTLVRAKFDVVVDPLALGERLMQVEAVKVLPRMATPLARATLRRFCRDQARLLAQER